MVDPISVFVIVVFVLLFIFALILIFNVHICDYNCKAITVSEEKAGNTNSIEYYTYLLSEMGKDGFWPIAFIMATVSTLIFAWYFSNFTWTIKDILLCFAINFFIIYMSFSFYLHHGINPLRIQVYEFLQEERNRIEREKLENNM